MTKQRLEAAIARIDRYLTPAADDVIFLAGSAFPLRRHFPRDDPQIETLMRGSLGSAPQIDGLAFVRPDFSSVRMRRDRERDEIDSISGSIAKQPYAQEMMESGQAHPGDEVGVEPVFYVQDLGVSFLSVMAPVHRDGEFAASSSPRCRWDSSRASSKAAIPTAPCSSSTPMTTSSPIPCLPMAASRPHDASLPARADGVARSGAADRASASRRGWPNGTSWTPLRHRSPAGTYRVLLDQVTAFSPQPWIVGIYFPASADDASRSAPPAICRRTPPWSSLPSP